jgi:hypothetical protein
MIVGRLSIEQLVARLRVGNLPKRNLPRRRLGCDVSHINKYQIDLTPHDWGVIVFFL